MSNEPATFSRYLERLAVFQGINLITGQFQLKQTIQAFSLMSN